MTVSGKIALVLLSVMIAGVHSQQARAQFVPETESTDTSTDTSQSTEASQEEAAPSGPTLR